MEEDAKEDKAEQDDEEEPLAITYHGFSVPGTSWPASCFQHS